MIGEMNMGTEFHVKRTIKRLAPEELDLNQEAQRRKQISDSILDLVYQKVMEKRSKRKGLQAEEGITDL